MKLFNTLAKKVLASMALVAAVAGMTGVAIAGFGPDGRPTKAYVQNGPGFDVPTLNAFTGVPGVGDERAFFTGQYPGADFLTDPLAEVKSGDELTLNIRVHNGADPSKNADGSGIAKDVKVRVALPTGEKTNHQATAYIEASNTTPKSIYDTLDFGMLSGSPFTIEYVAGSAKVSGNYINSVLSDEIINTGVLVGTDQLNGQVKGCFEQLVIVTLKVRIKSTPKITIDKTVRKLGTTVWSKDITANPGDTLEYSLKIKNVGEASLNNILVGDRLPPHQAYIAGSTRLFNRLTPAEGTQLNDGVVPGAIRLNATYSPNSEAEVRFQAKVNQNIAQTECGNPRFRNIATTRADGIPTDVESTADVVVNTGKECTEPVTPVYVCTDVKVEKLGGRKIKTTVSYNGAPAARVVFKNIEYNFGDGSTPLVSTSNPVEYTFAKDGTYKVSAKVTFAVDGVNKTVSGDACSESVTFTGVKPPAELPYTGASSNIALFIVTTVAGMFIFRAIALKKQ